MFTVHTDTFCLTPLGLLFLLCTFDQQKNHNLCSGPSNELSNQVWSQFTQWFQRRRLKMFTNDYDNRRRRTPSDGNTSHDPLG